MSKRIEYIIDDIKEQYLEKDNNIPWIIGFSGGKDSTVVLTLVWRALLTIREKLGNNALARQVYVVNNDTKKCQYVTLNFDNVYDLEYISLAQKGRVEADKLRLTLGMGGAMLVVVSHK